MTPAGIPDRVRAVRADLGLTQDSFGRLIGRSPETVRGWETGTRAIPRYHRRMIEAAELAIEHGGELDLDRALATGGPAYAWHLILDRAYSGR